MGWNRHAAYALVRTVMGVVFVFYGVGKLLDGVAGFSQGLRETFAVTPLPPLLVGGFGYALPFVELAVGVLLLLGLFTRAVLVGTGLLLLVLTVGMAVQQEPAVVANNVFFTVVVALLLWLEGANVHGFDRLRGGRGSTSPPGRAYPLPPLPRASGRRGWGRRTRAGGPPASS
jgi:thiosulfate dehydrogenase [quinone] large subunit